MSEQATEQNPQVIQPKRRGRPPKNLLSFSHDESTPTTENSGNPSTGSGQARAPRGRKGWEDVVRAQLNDIWALVAVGASFVNPIDAKIIADRAPRITDALIHLAQVKPAFRKMLLRSSESLVYTELIIALTPILVLIAVNHKLLPPIIGLMYGGLPSIKAENDANNKHPSTGSGQHPSTGSGQHDTDSEAFDFSSIFSAAMAAGGASDNHWADGEREDDVSA